MTDVPINLDGRRTAVERPKTELRRRTENDQPFLVLSAQLHFGSLENQMLAGPARTWGEAMEKWRFLLERFSVTEDAKDERIQKLIRRAIGDMERPRKREERE